jgi:hypothetical protein
VAGTCFGFAAAARGRNRCSGQAEEEVSWFDLKRGTGGGSNRQGRGATPWRWCGGPCVGVRVVDWCVGAERVHPCAVSGVFFGLLIQSKEKIT